MSDSKVEKVNEHNEDMATIHEGEGGAAAATKNEEAEKGKYCTVI